MVKNRNGSRGVTDGENKQLVSWRPFPERPLGMFVESVIQHLKDTAQPETMEALYRNPIPKDVEFYIIKKDIVLDGRKRPEGDNAPCPMCTPNKFLTGALIHIPSLQCVAVIGHCCADKEAMANAEREYKHRNRRDYEETYLLQSLPLVDARMAVLLSLQPAAAEAQRLYRKFKHNLPMVHSLLRSTKHQFRGNLMLSEIIRGGEDEEESDYFGPAGFRGRGTSEIETREHDFGILNGSLAVINEFHPVKDLETVIRQLESIESRPDEEAAINFICEMSERQRHAAVAIMEGIDKGVDKFAGRLKEFAQFFTRENAEVMNAFGTSPLNSLHFTVTFEILHKRPCLRIKHGSKLCKLDVGPQFAALDYEWPVKAL